MLLRSKECVQNYCKMAEDNQFSGIVPPFEVPDTVVYVEEEEIGIGLLRIEEV